MAAAAVAGGGIIGASIAWRLAQRGMRVEIFDAGVLGGEASFAGAGMLAPGAEITKRGGWTDLALESLAAYPEFVEELEAETGVPIDYRECGSVELAFTAEEWDALRRRAVLQSGLGIRSDELDTDAARRAVPNAGLAGVIGALHYPNDAIVDPRDVMAALRQALSKNGVVVHERAAVTEVRSDGKSALVRTGAGEWHGDCAVLAAGAWTSRIAVVTGGTLQNLPAAVPVRGHLIGWRLPPSLGPILRHEHTYLLQRNSGFLIAGTSEERVGFDRRVDPATVSAISRRARSLLPSLPLGAPDEAWIGFRPGTESGEPVIGRLGDSRIWLAYGHYRNGILMTPATSRRIAAEITSS
jgi:glycine oxidase